MRQRGVALIIALVVVALATVLATRIGADGALGERRAATLLAQEQALEVAHGAEAWALEVLRDSPPPPLRRVSLDQLWATPLPVIPIDGGDVEGPGGAGPALEDLQGRFNLNSLIDPTTGGKDVAAFAQFQRLLAALELEPKWASLVLDWIDANNTADGVDGAEDAVYLGQHPPYWTANHLMLSTSELLALPGFGADRYRRLRPYVAALPPGTTLNVCTASGIVLDSLAPGLNAFAVDPKQLALNRQKGCFPTRADVQQQIQSLIKDPAELQQALRAFDESSQYFRIVALVRLGTTQLTLYSLLQRDPQSGVARVLLRTLGTE